MNPNEPSASLLPSKIRPDHRERWAIVYVRQSHPQQVERHRESAEVQANLQLRARLWGWPAERIRVLDGDQGCSGTSTAGRDDFAYLLGEIALGHVGLVLGFQINRLAREDEACCRLIQTCATFDTLLADTDGVYHPHDFNDRMLLTLKGFMGGFELHQIQQRMQAGRLNRVQRGEWLGQPPPGFIVGPERKLQFDPDEEVQQRVRLVFEQFAQLGSLARVLRVSAPRATAVALSTALWTGCRAVALAAGETRERAADAASSGLRRRVYLGPASHRSQPRRAGPTRHRPCRETSREVSGVSPRQSSGLHHLGRARNHPQTPEKPASARSHPRTSARPKRSWPA